MARRAVKKTTTKSRNKERFSSPVDSSSPQAPGKSAGGLSFSKFLIFIILVLAILYGPSFFKNGFKSEPKYFLVKEIGRFTGTETLGKPIFANDVVAVAPNLMAITDNLGSQVLIYDFKGKLIRKWGKGGEDPLEFHEPSGIATDHKGHVFVLDTWNGAVKEFDLNGKLIKSLDLTHFGFFYGPRRIGWGGDSIWVSNASNSRLARISLSGELLSVWSGKEQMGSVSSAILDGKGHAVVGDMNGKKSRINTFDETGKIIQTIKTEYGPDDLAFDSKGRLFVASYYDCSQAFDPNGNWLGLLVEEAQPKAALGQMMGIDITPDDTILTCSGDLVRIYRVSEEKGK